MVPARSEAQGAIEFQVLAEIAVGTTARVDLCRATAPPHLAGKLLAVKRLHQHIAEDPSFANQFLDEVWMTSALKHPNVVEVAGWGSDEDGMYLAVELVSGVSLARLMKTIFDTGEAFTERMVVYIASRLCRGLAVAHGLCAPNGELLQLVHRDLTPSNVLVSFSGDLKIADFGLAKAKQRLTKTLTGLLKGQPQYMAPEQARGDAIDHRTDLFALGVMMFELFTRRKPWLAASDFDAVQAILSRPPDNLQTLRPKIDKELSLVVNRCLEKDPAARFQSAGEIQARLDEWLLVHGYQEGNEDALGRFVRRNGMRQMRWFERAIAGDLIEGRPEPPKASSFTGQNPAVSMNEGDESDETDVTDVGALVSEMQQRSSDPRTAKRVLEDADYNEEVPTIVHKSGSVPLRPKAGPAPVPPARLAPGTRPPSKPPPRLPGRPGPLGAGASPTPGRVAPRQGPPPPFAKPFSPERNPPPNDASTPRPPGVAVHSTPFITSQRPPGPAAVRPGSVGAMARPAMASQGANGRLPAGQGVPSKASENSRNVADGAVATGALPNALGPARGVHESILDEESDARTTAINASPRNAARSAGVSHPGASPRDGRMQAPLILPPMRGSSPSISDPESEEIPTLPIQGVPEAMQSSSQNAQGATAQRPGQQPAFQNQHQRAGSPRLPSLQSEEEDWGQGRGPFTEDRLFAEADRLALEAVRFGDEAKAAAARADRQAVIGKIAGDAAAIAVEAVRIASTAGISEAARRLEDAYALEATIRRLLASPLDVSPSASARIATAPLPIKRPPSSSPGMAPSREPPPSYAPSSSLGSVAPGPLHNPQNAGPPSQMGGRNLGAPGPGGAHEMRQSTAPLPMWNAGPASSSSPASGMAFRGSVTPPPPNAQGTGAFAAFEERLRPTIFGLPSIHVAALAIGTFVLVLILMWILIG